MTYKVKLNIFEGPLDLLLFLIKKEKIDIYDIPISRITAQYIEYLELMKMLDLQIAGEFLVMAATLIHIKSKMLLPREEQEPEEEELADPREELVKRLLEYKKYKDAADKLAEMRERHKDIFVRRGAGEPETFLSGDGEEYFEASLFDLITAFQKVLTSVPKETFHQVVRNKFTVSEKIHEIYHILAKTPRILFSSLFSNSCTREEVITVFLAILELMKMREVVAVQKSVFDDIEVIRNPEVEKAPAEGGRTEGEESIEAEDGTWTGSEN
ncbi:MAG: segregation/condensation protein A [Candidatus Omnitrophica bacterium]|nr:segregation/condensation protein A [Candidatus Omnitrophota bacterium]MDD5487576.1 segregation/condensation protein A [Candidatus Omnitrophota bacterium]